MKIICLDAHCSNFLVSGGLDDESIRVFADSTLMRDVRQPLFLPRWAEDWTLWILPAIRVCRQGLNIGKEFASRYFDSIAAVAMLLPSGYTPVGAPVASLIADSTLRAGEWMPWPNPTEGKETSAMLQIDTQLANIGSNDIESESKRLNVEQLNIEEHICRLSRLATLKTGDMVMLYHTEIALRYDNIRENQIITAYLNNFESLRLKIK